MLHIIHIYRDIYTRRLNDSQQRGLYNTDLYKYSLLLYSRFVLQIKTTNKVSFPLVVDLHDVTQKLHRYVK